MVNGVKGKWLVFCVVAIAHAIILALAFPQETQFITAPLTPTPRIQVKRRLAKPEPKVIYKPKVFKARRVDPTIPVEHTEEIREPLEETADSSIVFTEMEVPFTESIEEPTSTEPVISEPVYSQSQIEEIRSQWFESIRNHIEKRKKYPRQAVLASIEGRVMVRLVIRKDGTIDSCGVVSKRKGILERATEATLLAITALPPIPDALNKTEITVELPLVYTLK